jgi:short subunit dehydrogenase-like uncharacterized protein
MKSLMIYGATGYTGRMASRNAAALDLPLVVAGRAPTALAALAEEIGATPRAFDLDDEAAIDAALADVTVLLNCAGPFHRTAAPLMRAAIRNGVHYLDIAAELDSYRLAETLDGEARHAGVLLLPGSGGSVAMLGCLAGHVAARVAEPRAVALALRVAGGMSRGSALSARESLMTATLVRSGGRLVPASAETRPFDFGAGPVACFPVTLPDLITVGRATGIADVATFVHVVGGAFPDGDLAALPDGPRDEERAANRYQAIAEVVGRDGVRAASRLDTVNGYTFTPLAAVEAARRVLAGEVRPGFQTPAGLFGNGFAATIADTRIIDL